MRREFRASVVRRFRAFARLIHNALKTDAFERWIAELDDKVIQGQFGYEDGEFSVFERSWFPMWRAGYTPRQAFQRALDIHAEARREESAVRRVRGV